MILRRFSQSPPDQFLFLAFVVLFIWLPLPLGSNRQWAVSLMEVWVIGISATWLCLAFVNKVQFEDVFKKSKWVLICLALFLAWQLIQLMPLPSPLLALISPQSLELHGADAEGVSISVNKVLGISHLLESMSYGLIFCLTLVLLNTTRRIKIFAMAIVFSGLFQALYGSFMTLSGSESIFFMDKVSSLGAASGTFVNRNHLAGYLEMTLAIGIGLMLATLSRRPSHSFRDWLRSFVGTLLSSKARLRIMLAIMVIALVLTRSRMGNTAFFTSLAIAGVIGLVGLWWLTRQGKISRFAMKPISILFVSLIAIDLFIVGAWFGIDKVKDRIENTSFATEIRDEVDINTIDHWRDFTLTGSGGGTFAEVFPHYKSALFPGYIDHAHNDYLELGSEYGIIGIVLLGVAVLLSLSQAIQSQFIRRSYFMRGIGFASSMGIVAILVHSTVDFNLHIPSNAALFIVLLGFAWLSRYQPN